MGKVSYGGSVIWGNFIGGRRHMAKVSYGECVIWGKCHMDDVSYA